jgi:site-specific recombinase XerD
MGALRDRMIRDMTVRGFSPRTHESYIRQVVGLARYYRRPPDQLSDDEVQTYLAMLFTERKRAWSTCAQAAHAFRFLYHVTLGRPHTEFRVPAPRQPQRLPEILSRQEVGRLLEACDTPRDRLLLATTYAAGLRVSEVVALKVSDIDADRMTVRVEQGKGRKDRYVPLSPRLLHDLRADGRTVAPPLWVFANRPGTKPIDVTVAQKVYAFAKRRAGLQKHGGIHALRHAYATHLIEAGRDVHYVQHLLGHRHVTTTMRYFHLSQARALATGSPLDLLEPPPR